MKKKLTITASLIFLCSILFGQGQLPPWLIEWAPDSNYVLLSGPGGIYNHRLLSSLGLGGGSDLDSSLYSVDGSITDPIRTVNLSGSRVIFYDTGNGYVSIENNRELGLFSVRKTGQLDSLVVKFDWGLGTDYGLFLEGPLGSRNIFSVTGQTYSLGGGFNVLKIQANVPLNNAATRLLALDPITENVEQIDISSLVANTSPCQDTIVQASHGFSLGDLIGQSPNNGPYFVGNVGVPDSIPVWFVCSVISADSFTIASTGTIDWTHGKLPGRDYFAQDASGDLDTIPDADYTFFGFRTIGTDRAAFDIPELVVDGSSGGGGGSSPDITFSNGLNDQDPGPDIDGELGGELERHTLIRGNNFDMTWDSLRNCYIVNLQGEMLIETDTLGDRQAYLIVDVANSDLVNINYATNTKARMLVNQNGTVTLVSSDVDGSNPTSFSVNRNSITATGIPEYASDVAADADGALPTGGLYTVIGDRSIRIKP